MRPSLIATPEILAAFFRTKIEFSQQGTQRTILHAFSIFERARVLVCWAGRALETLFSGLAISLDDQNGIQVQDFAMLPLHHRPRTPTLYDVFLASQSMRGSRPEKHTDSGSNIYQVPSSSSSTDSARSLTLYRTREAANGKALWPQKYDAYRLEVFVGDDGRDSCGNREIVDMEENNKLQTFPDYIDCSCLSCQGYEVTMVLGDHHNTECACDKCTRTAVTGVSHTFPPVKENGGVKPRRQAAEGLVSYSPLLPRLYPFAALKIPKTHSSEKQNLINKTGDGMTDFGYNSGTKEGVLDTSGLCKMLGATRLRLQQQQAELLTRIPGSQGFSVATQDIESDYGSDDSIPAFALERNTLQHDSLPRSLPTCTKEGGVFCKDDQDRKGLKHEERVANWWTAPATIVATAKPQFSLPAAPITPENQIWRSVDKDLNEHNDGVRIVSAGQGRSHSMTPESDVDSQAEIDPFVAIPEIMSELVKIRARRAAFSARLSQNYVEWVDNRARNRPNNSGSPTPLTRAHASSEWRKVHGGRQTKLLRLDCESIRLTQILGLRKASSSPALTIVILSSSTGAIEPKRFLSAPVLASVPDPELSEETDHPHADQAKSFLAEPTLAFGQPLNPYVIVEDHCAGIQVADVASMQDAVEGADRTQRHFFHSRKKSRFSSLFESLKAGKR